MYYERGKRKVTVKGKFLNELLVTNHMNFQS